mgnify:CR=1 FL=1
MFHISLWLSKIYYFVTQKKPVTDRAGILAIKIDKNFIKHVKKPKIVIAVTGTNGKTTTCNLLVDLLEEKGYKVTSNREGANFQPGIAKALMKGVSIFNKPKVDYAVIEFDELNSKKILPFLNPNYIAVGNLFSDTMKRNAHTDYIFNKINTAIPNNSILILNADDLISSQLGNNNKKIFFSISKLESDLTKNNSLVQDAKICPKCYSLLRYKYIHYNHLGKAICPKCGFTNYNAKYILTKIDYKNKNIVINNESYFLINDGLFNIYNELLAITILRELGINNINESLQNLKIVKSRYSNYKIKNLEVITQLAKGQNPIAVSRSFDYVKSLNGNKEVIIILDDIYDKKSDSYSEIITWLYDSDFEFLNAENIKRIIVGGFRANDYKVRLLLAGIPESKIYISDKEEETYKYLDLKNTDKVIIIHDIYLVNMASEIVNKIKDVLK